MKRKSTAIKHKTKLINAEKSTLSNVRLKADNDVKLDGKLFHYINFHDTLANNKIVKVDFDPSKMNFFGRPHFGP